MEIREQFDKIGKSQLVGKSVSEIPGSWKNSELGLEIHLDGWRVFCEHIWRTELSSQSVFREWVGYEINIDYLLSYGLSDFIMFWATRAKAVQVPRSWIRSAVFLIQAEKKVTNGNPTDASIATNFVDVDFVLSADKNFISMANKIHNDAPFHTACGILLPAGTDAVEKLFSAISDGYFSLGSTSRIH